MTLSIALDADARIAMRELELATIQTEVTLPLQLELNLQKEALKITLENAAVFAGTVVELLDELGLSLEEGLGRVGDDLTGRIKKE